MVKNDKTNVTRNSILMIFCNRLLYVISISCAMQRGKITIGAYRTGSTDSIVHSICKKLGYVISH